MNNPRNNFDVNSSVNCEPKRVMFPFGWIGHMHFAYWLISKINPRVFVELGVHSGNSYFIFCQSVLENKLETQCHGIDTWQGDEHSGTYEAEIFFDVDSYNHENFLEFSRLHKTTFDNALNFFENGSVDLLHIDGLHTYEAVKHDFEAWLPKLSENAFVLFHDIQVFDRDFGVYKFWSELKNIYPLSFEFRHSHGLGVICLSNNPSKFNSIFFDGYILSYAFDSLGKYFLERITFKQELSEKDAELFKVKDMLSQKDAEIQRANNELSEKDAELFKVKDMLSQKEVLYLKSKSKLMSFITRFLKKLL